MLIQVTIVTHKQCTTSQIKYSFNTIKLYKIYAQVTKNNKNNYNKELLISQANVVVVCL